MGKPLSGMTAIVTGGTRGIGKAIADRLLKDGAKTIVTGTSPDGPAPEGCEYIAADFSDRKQLEACAEKISNLNVDILVNNAGINKISPFAEIDPIDFENIHAVNVLAPFRLCQAVLSAMTEKGRGRIVNIASIWSVVSKSQRGAYSASKFAIDGMTAALSAEVAAHGILVNSVSPGFIDTDLTRKTFGAEAMRELAEQVPAKRMGTPAEIAALVSWLCGPENTYITGQNIVIDGGFTRV